MPSSAAATTQQQHHRQLLSQPIALAGSVDLIVEFLDYSINSILFQRGIYPSDEFNRVKQYDLMLWTTGDGQLRQYMDTIFTQLKKWMMENVVEKIVLVIQSVGSREVLERWTFDIRQQSASGAADKENSMDTTMQTTAKVAMKPLKEIQNEIQAIIRQITASVTFLPVLEDRCTFNLLVYADRNATVPSEWIDSDPKYIENAEQVRLRSLHTGVHKVDTLVAYKYEQQ